QTWTDFIVDTNGNGKRDEPSAAPAGGGGGRAGGRRGGGGGEAATAPAAAPAAPAAAPAADGSKDTKIGGSCYAVMVSPTDNAVWCTILGSPGSFIRIAPGTNPPATALTEIYNV